jgi:oligopeptidase B
VVFGAVAGENRGDGAMEEPVEWEDPYFWLRDDNRKDTEILEHLEAENSYTRVMTEHLSGTVDTIYEELKGRMTEDDTSVPTQHDGGWLYYSRTEKGNAYATHCRRRGIKGWSPAAADSREQTLLRVADLAEGKPHCDVSRVRPSPNHDMFGYAVDFSGYETYSVHFVGVSRDGRTTPVEDVLEGTSGSWTWGKDGKYVYYMKMDDTHRPCALWQHEMGTEQSADTKLWEEPNEEYWGGMGVSADGNWLMVGASSKTTSEEYIMALGEEAERAPQLTCIREREEGVLYDSEAWGKHLCIVTNIDGAKNFKLCVASLPGSSSGEEDGDEEEEEGVGEWRDMIPHNPERKLDSLHPFRGFWVLDGREGGLPKVWVVSHQHVMMGLEGTWSHTFMTPLPGFDGETIGVFSLASNRVYDAPAVRYAYQSPLTPPAVCDFFPPPSAIQGQLLPESEWEGPTVDVAAAPRGVVVRKQNEVPGYNRDQYRTARVFATAKDGTHVPMSIIYSPSAVETTADATELPATELPVMHDHAP